MLLGRHYLDRGQPLAAAMRFQRLEGNAAAEACYEPELSVLLATCWLLAGMPDRAEATLLSLKARDPRATIRIGDRNVSLFAEDESRLGVAGAVDRVRVLHGGGGGKRVGDPSR